MNVKYMPWHHKMIAGLLLVSQLAAWTESVEASPIAGVTISSVSSELTSSNSIYDRAAIHVVDGSGLDALSQHTNAPDGTMWDANTFNPSLTNGPTDTNPTITFDLGSQYVLNSFRVWNFNSLDNQQGQPFTERSVRNVEISISSNGVAYSDLGTFVFAQAPGMSNYLGEIVTLPNVAAQFVSFAILTNYASDLTFGVGLSEIQFFGSSPSPVIPEPGTVALVALGIAVLGKPRRRL